MNTQKKTFLVFIFSLFSVLISFSQGEAKIWYFGNQAGLDFNTNPPTILTNNAIPGNWYSTAVISDAAGNLLFYSNGQNIWDKTHAIMANGSGLSISSNNGSQNVIIIKKLISGSPLVESNEIVYPHLEKMIVDLYCDWDKIHPYKNPTFYKFFKKLYSNFSINESKLLRYADRRKKKMVFVKHLQRLKHINS